MAKLICPGVHEHPSRGHFSRNRHVRHVGHVTLREADEVTLPSWSSSAVVVLDDPSQTFPSGGQVVFQLIDSMLRGVSFDGAGGAFGYQLAVDDLEVGDPRYQLGSIWTLDLGAQPKPQSLSERVALGAEPTDLLTSNRQISSQASRRRLPAVEVKGTWDANFTLAPSSGIHLVSDAIGIDKPSRDARRLRHSGEGDRRAASFQVLDRRQCPLTLTFAVFGPGCSQHHRSALVSRCGVHAVCLVELTTRGIRRAALVRRNSALDCSTSARSSGSSCTRRRCICSATRANASISALMLAIT